MPRKRARKSPPPRSRADQYHDLGDAIIQLGVETMAPCPQCKKAGTVCVIRKGYRKCGPCMKKNMVCGGFFSKAEFDKLSRKKAELREQSAAGQKMMLQLAQELLKTQKEVADAERRAAILTRRQEEMADREAQALGELDESSDSVVVPSPDKPASDPSLPTEPLFAIMDDDPFCWDDPSFEGVIFSDPSVPLDFVVDSVE